MLIQNPGRLIMGKVESSEIDINIEQKQLQKLAKLSEELSEIFRHTKKS